MSKKNIWKIVIAVIVIIGIIVLVSQCGGTIKKGLGIGGPSKSELAAKNDSLNNELASYKSYTNTQEDSISTLNSLLDDCKKGKRHRKATSTAKTPVASTNITPSQPAASPTKTITVPADSPSRTENNGLCGDQYTGVYDGAYGVTINDESMLVYFISNEELSAGEGKMTISAPLLNGQDPSKEFYWDNQKKLWIYESNTIITINRLLSNQPIIWCAYIGEHQQWGYPMFLPHEIVKTGSASAKTALANGQVLQHQNDVGCDFASKIQFKKRSAQAL